MGRFVVLDEFLYVLRVVIKIFFNLVNEFKVISVSFCASSSLGKVISIREKNNSYLRSKKQLPR